MKNLNIQQAKKNNLDGIVEIYNQAILNTTATFDIETKTVENQTEWFNSHDERFPIIVALINNQQVGWASLSHWSDRTAYADTAEISVYVKEDFQGKGIGKTLMKRIIDIGYSSKIHTIIARIADGNERSIKLHLGLGFTKIGLMKEVGFKFGRRIDVQFMQKMMN